MAVAVGGALTVLLAGHYILNLRRGVVSVVNKLPLCDRDEVQIGQLTSCAALARQGCYKSSCTGWHQWHV